MKNLRNLAIVTMLLITGRAVAQKPGDAERAKLNFLAGSFVTEANMPPSKPVPKGAHGKGTSLIAWALDSTFLLIDEQSVNSLFGQYKGHGVLGYDARTSQFELSMFNNFGDHPTYTGNFVGDTLMLETRVPAPGHPFDQRLVWYKNGDAVILKVLNDMGKGFVPVIEQTATPFPQPKH